jgi:hypothetical protein
MGETRGFETEVVWWKREHRLNLASVLPTLLGDVRSDDWFGVADLKRDPGNESDKNAVLVSLMGKPVGYLPGDEAKRLAAWLDEREAEGTSVQANACIQFGMNEMAVRLSLY